jgi:4-hydroxy-3-methylbut-2-en-1-yl diphosphate synthase IspG/GcpE
VTIAVMGCIVNGPGEMADADFGYVGGAPGKIDLYVGKEVVRKAIPSEQVRCKVQGLGFGVKAGGDSQRAGEV